MSFSWGGAPVLFVDTAGICEPNDPIEKEGVNRTRAYLKKADLIISLTDDPRSKHLIQKNNPLLKVVNKADLRENKKDNNSIIHISSISGRGIDLLKKNISHVLGINKLSTEATYLSTARQYNAIKICSSAIKNAQTLFASDGLDIELLSFEIRSALDAVDSILGRTSPNDILNHVFGTLCVGK
ncbi:hypothetical protein JYT44_00025 [Caldithrix abyssi]|nr:hypothetical protein [Caldithrix abyssi]